MRFPRYKAGNVLRGALGTVLRDTADYKQVFAPKLDEGPSGLKDPPRPFIFRCGHLNGARIRTGEPFWFDLHLFHVKHSVDLFANAFRRFADAGLGIERGRAQLDRSEQLPVDFAVPLQSVNDLAAQFITLTEMPMGSFGNFFRHARNRVASLATLYGDGPPDLDYIGLNERSEAVVTVSSDLRYIHAERKSTRTGQVHPMGGFIGNVRYTGDLTEFMPVLSAAVWTGVGRHTVWGQGEFRLSYGSGVERT